jgi:hypothetical protein
MAYCRLLPDHLLWQGPRPAAKFSYYGALKTGRRMSTHLAFTPIPSPLIVLCAERQRQHSSTFSYTARCGVYRITVLSSVSTVFCWHSYDPKLFTSNRNSEQLNKPNKRIIFELVSDCTSRIQIDTSLGWSQVEWSSLTSTCAISGSYKVRPAGPLLPV